MNQLQRIGLTGMTILLLVGFWAGLWYQGQRKGGAIVLAAAGEELADGLSGGPAGAEAAGRGGEAVAGAAMTGKARQSEGTVANDRTGEAGGALGADYSGASAAALPAAGSGMGFDLAGPSEAAEASGPNEGTGLVPPGAGEQSDLPAKREGDMAVHVVGKVAAPGLYFLPPGNRIYDAVMLALPEKDADLGRINLALPLEDGMQIRVPVIGKPSSWEDGALIVRADDNLDLWQESGQSQTGAKGKININKAAAAELETLPGIGPAYSRRIIQYREEKGGFRTVEDLLKVKGIGQAKMEELRDLVCCS